MILPRNKEAGVSNWKQKRCSLITGLMVSRGRQIERGSSGRELHASTIQLNNLSCLFGAQYPRRAEVSTKMVLDGLKYTVHPLATVTLSLTKS
jgi:hypothetical protein